MPEYINMSDAFLSGQGIPVALDEIEGELVRLWGPSAGRVGGPDLENPNVTRVALANLVVARLSNDGQSLASASIRWWLAGRAGRSSC